MVYFVVYLLVCLFWDFVLLLFVLGRVDWSYRYCWCAYVVAGSPVSHGDIMVLPRHCCLDWFLDGMFVRL